MVYRAILGVVMLLSVACTSTSERSCDRVVKCELSRQESVERIDMLFQSAEIIPLEMGDESMVSADSEIIEYKGDYIIINKQRRNCLRFDADGRFLNRIGTVGSSRNEYLNIASVQMDGDDVLIYSSGNLSIYRYSIDGEFISVVETGVRAQQLLKVDDRYYGYFGYGNGQQVERLLVYDMNFEVVERCLPSDSKVICFSDMVDPITICDGKVLLRETYSRSIYNLSESGAISEFGEFDFGRYNIPSACFSQSDAMKAAEMMLSNSFATLYRYDRGQREAFVQVNYQMVDGDVSIYAMVGVERDGNYEWITATPSGECAILFSTLRYISDDGVITALVDSDVVAEFNDRNRGFIKNVDRLNSNAAVVKFRLK